MGWLISRPSPAAAVARTAPDLRSARRRGHGIRKTRATAITRTAGRALAKNLKRPSKNALPLSPLMSRERLEAMSAAEEDGVVAFHTQARPDAALDHRRKSS